ncbi:hypothetical protein CH330_02580 [candidate division WOR-3 bacterium JGI_Cruoil_03_51_56]|uniref:TldD/PmbA family protein n=1 Tax=candidate division WOR-3 bacterium JGI_Cruoil_03_51_56 TaxID=1973747 RepID=A0A235BWG6_UNCW3|nr:MAG: hypothetical protein CH330_02580 [candidate division WOR-3 bacterium JGI_Cruoil_03_51_56]
MQLEKFAKQTINLAAKLKLDDIELFLTYSRTLSAKIENRDINLELKEGIFNAGIRVIKKGKLGYVPITEPDLNVLRTGIKAALAKAGPAPFVNFAVLSDRKKRLELYDDRITRMLGSPSKIKNLARNIIERAFTVKGIENFEGGIGLNIEDRLVTTMHNRTPAFATRTAFSAFVDVNSRDFDFVAGRRMPDLEKVAKLGENLARSLPKRSTTPESEGMKGKKLPVIIHPLMLETILRNLVAEHIYASTVQEGMSRYRVGQQVAPITVTLWDDATAPYAESTFPTDDEGTNTRRTTVIENGMLKTLLYDRASAAKDGVESTGNGRHRPVLIEDEHEAPVRCTANDLFLAPGKTPLNRMIKGIKRGILLKYLLGFHTANRTTGDFTNTLYVGRIIRDGRLVALPEPGRWAVKGNALDCLKNITAVSRETINVASGVLPWVQVDLTVT